MPPYRPRKGGCHLGRRVSGHVLFQGLHAGQSGASSESAVVDDSPSQTRGSRGSGVLGQVSVAHKRLLLSPGLKIESPLKRVILLLLVADRSETLPFFPLSWVITWCAHDLHDFGKVARLFDFLLCFNPLMSVYLTTAVSMGNSSLPGRMA